jgi:hypothetical protein
VNSSWLAENKDRYPAQSARGHLLQLMFDGVEQIESDIERRKRGVGFSNAMIGVSTSPLRTSAFGLRMEGDF